MCAKFGVDWVSGRRDIAGRKVLCDGHTHARTDGRTAGGASHTNLRPDGRNKEDKTV